MQKRSSTVFVIATWRSLNGATWQLTNGIFRMFCLASFEEHGVVISFVSPLWKLRSKLLCTATHARVVFRRRSLRCRRRVAFVNVSISRRCYGPHIYIYTQWHAQWPHGGNSPVFMPVCPACFLLFLVCGAEFFSPARAYFFERPFWALKPFF